ncbi:MAG: hypothetical protein WC758_08175 [Candidatus Woesearchaeota archaeon]
MKIKRKYCIVCEKLNPKKNGNNRVTCSKKCSKIYLKIVRKVCAKHMGEIIKLKNKIKKLEKNLLLNKQHHEKVTPKA